MAMKSFFVYIHLWTTFTSNVQFVVVITFEFCIKSSQTMAEETSMDSGSRSWCYSGNRSIDDRIDGLEIQKTKR